MKIDPYKHKERYLKWRRSINQAIPGLNWTNSELVLRYLDDMENGINVSSINKKGSRSYIRLNTLKQRIIYLIKEFEKRFCLDNITCVTEENLLNYFADMRSGKILTQKGEKYKSIPDFAMNFKAFWHWYQKSSKKRGIQVPDITVDLDTSGTKPQWVYLTEEQIKRLCDNARYEYKVLFMFLFDSGLRAPTELVNIKVSDLYNGCRELYIRDEISKTFGRKIKLLLCSDILKDYIKNKQLTQQDYLFAITPYVVNRYLKRLAQRILGDIESPAGQKYSELTMYDFRHCSCCYWLPRYKSESALKYRFGWKKSEKIHYYSEMLGMKDTIVEEDLLIDTTKTEIEKRLEKTEKEKEIMEEKLVHIEKQMEKIFVLTSKLYENKRLNKFLLNE